MKFDEIFDLVSGEKRLEHLVYLETCEKYVLIKTYWAVEMQMYIFENMKDQTEHLKDELFTENDFITVAHSVKILYDYKKKIEQLIVQRCDKDEYINLWNQAAEEYKEYKGLKEEKKVV